MMVVNIKESIRKTRNMGMGFIPGQMAVPSRVIGSKASSMD